MIPKEIIVKSLRRAKEERGLRVAEPNNYLSEGHIRKADHNLIVMTDLNKLGHEDWVVISAYYAMYHSAMAVLAKIGLESKDHATTAAVLEYFFGVWKVKRARETVQYGISISYKETNIVMKNTRDFVNKMKIVLNELDKNLIDTIRKNIKELQDLAT